MRRHLVSFFCLLVIFPHESSAQEPYRLQPGDSVEIWVAQEEQLNRHVSIGPDGRLSLPLIGQVQAARMTVDELSIAFKERLQTYYSENLDVTVMLQPSEFHARSVFVAGDVNTPGIYLYRSDMTVLHVVSLAGGLYRATFEVADQDRSTMLRGDVSRMQNRLYQLDVTMARLQAELSNATKIEASQAELAAIPPEALETILPQEQAVLNMRVAELRIRENAEEQLRNIAVRSLEAAQEQLQSVNTRIDLARQRLDNANRLIAQGVTQGAQRLELESAIALLEGEKSQHTAALATQEAAVVNYDAGMEAFIQTRHTELMTELNTNRREREVLASTLTDSQRALKAYDEATAGAANSVITYTVLRAVDGRTEEIPASELTPIEPGDLVRVIKLLAGENADNAGD